MFMLFYTFYIGFSLYFHIFVFRPNNLIYANGQQ